MNLRRHRHDERGSISVLVVTLATAFLALAGLGIDGSAGLVAGQRAADLANEAARAGARDGATPNLTGPIVLDPSRARVGALAWLTAEGVDAEMATVSVADDTVTVNIRQRQATTLLRLAGVGHLDVDATASARPAQGITKEGAR